MKSKGKSVCVRLVTALLFFAGFVSVLRGAVLVPQGATWRYNDTGEDAGTAWIAPDFDDSAWPMGAAQFGYGDGDEDTVISYGPNGNAKHITYYFRREFMVMDPTRFPVLRLRVIRDDGCVVYLNGTEVARSNMPEGEITFDTLASNNVGGGDEDAWFDFAVDGSLLVEGVNVIAAEVHQSAANSSDLSFDLLLDDQSVPVFPSVELLSPADGGTVPAGTVQLQCRVSDLLGLETISLYFGKAGTVVSFSGPEETDDAMIREDQADTPNGARTSVSVDGQGPHSHVLLAFPAIFDDAGGPVPLGAFITEATVEINFTDGGNTMHMYRLLEDWVEEEVTWNDRMFGEVWSVAGAETEPSHTGIPIDVPGQPTGARAVDLTEIVQQWSDGEPNYGVIFVESGGNGVDFNTSESNNPPLLTIRYGGTWQEQETQTLSGTEQTVTFTVSVQPGQTYRWNCLVTNTKGNQSWASSDFTFSTTGGGEGLFIRGDVNQDGRRNLADALRVLGELFSGTPPSTCADAADANDDGRLNLADALRILGFLFSGQGELPAPAPDCGTDPTPDTLQGCVFQGCGR